MTKPVRLRLSTIYSLNFQREIISPYLTITSGPLSVTKSQENSKKEFANWDMKVIIRATHLEEEQQRRQGWPVYRRMRYNCWEGGSPTAIAFMLKLTSTGYTTHPEDINSFRIHDFPPLERRSVHQFPYQAHKILTPFRRAPGLKSLDQVDVCRYSIYRYWGLGVRPGIYVAKV